MDEEPSSPPSWEGGDCPATRNYYGFTECVLKEGHRRDHQDHEGMRWGEEDAIW
jgi:hypothetical protein